MDAETGSANIYGTITDMMEIFQRPSILLGREELCSGTSSKAPERAGICEPDDGEVDAERFLHMRPTFSKSLMVSFGGVEAALHQSSVCGARHQSRRCVLSE